MEFQPGKSFLCLLLGLCGVLIVACGPSGTPAQPAGQGAKPATEAQPERGGTLRLLAAGHLNYGTTDPHRSPFGPIPFSGQSTNKVLKRNIMSGNYEIIPELAESWDAAPDGMSYTFRLHKGVKFHNVPPVNGREFTADDVEYMIRRISADPEIVPAKWVPFFVKRSDFVNVAGFEKPDKYTIVVKMKKPDPTFLHNMANNSAVILPHELIEENPEKLVQDKIIGTGPFMHKEYVPDVRHVVERNPDYWKKDERGVQLPYLDKLVKDYYSSRGADVAASVAAFLSGQIDALAAIGGGNNLNSADIETVMRQMGDKSYATSSPGYGVFHLRFNTKRPPFDNVKMRRAVTLALDREQIKSALSAPSTLSGFIPPLLAEGGAQTVENLLKLPGYREPKEQDIAEAKKLVREAGFDGVAVGVHFHNPDWVDSASIIKEQLGRIGINVSITINASSEVSIANMEANKFEMMLWSQAFDGEIGEYVYSHFHTKGSRNYYKFSDPNWDDLAEKQRAAVNLEERKKIIKEVIAYQVDIVPNAPISSGLTRSIYRSYTHGFGTPVNSGDASQNTDVYWVDKH
ncbi:MAG: ABC transporter substrate-binding protein [Dehalococcoidia bacterium]|nr:ABC transporter substrate-binding protein [Dehalococcoidia bacterium]